MIGICHKCYSTGIAVSIKHGNGLCKDCEEVESN